MMHELNNYFFLPVLSTLTDNEILIKAWDIAQGTKIIVGTLTEVLADEDKCKDIVDMTLNGFYKRYDSIWDLSGFEGCDTASESLQSFINTLPESEEYLILKNYE